MANALTAIIKHFGWQGNVASAFRQAVATDREAVNETVDEALDSMDLQIDKTFHESMYAMEDGDAAKRLADRKERAELAGRMGQAARARRREVRQQEPLGAQAWRRSRRGERARPRQSRLEMETYLKNAVGRDVVVMTGAEATGYGEMQYGDGSTSQGITVCVTLGKTIGISLFDNGVLAHNPRDVERQVATWDYPRWDDAPLPRPVLQEGDVEPLEEEWDRWAARVEHYLSRVEAVCKPDNFIVCGRASVSYDKWAHKMRGIETPVRCSKQGLNAAVQGAAQGTREIRRCVGTPRVRAAIGHSKGLSPQKLTDEMLEAVFDEFDEDSSGTLSADELNNAISRLGVTLTNAELKELFVEMDSEMTGDIRKGEFVSWWRDSIGGSAVEIIHTMDEYTQVMEDAAGTGQLTCLVGVTYCKPCKAFSKKYGDFAERFSDARFKVFGNENKDMTTLCRDELKEEHAYLTFPRRRAGAHAHRRQRGEV